MTEIEKAKQVDATQIALEQAKIALEQVKVDLAKAEAVKSQHQLDSLKLSQSPASCLEKIMQIGCNDKIQLQCDHADHELIVNHAIVECRCTRHKHEEAK